MMPNLNLVDHVLAMGRRYQDAGRHRDALTVFTRLSRFRYLPAEAAEESQARLAELYLKRRKYKHARRHLTAALRHQPDNARYHYLLATALQAEEGTDLQRAAEHYRRALELDPGHIKCLADYGLLLLRLGQTEEGLSRLREAAERAPDDVEVLGKRVKGLRLAGRSDEARSLLQVAMFRNARLPRFRKLWNEFRFQQARASATANACATATARRTASNRFCCRSFASSRTAPRPVIARRSCAAMRPTPSARGLTVSPSAEAAQRTIRPPGVVRADSGPLCTSDASMFNRLATSVLRRLSGPPAFQVYGKARGETRWRIVGVHATHRRDMDSRWPRFLFRGTCITWTAEIIAVGWDFAEEVLREQMSEPASRERPVEVAGGRIRDSLRRAAAGLRLSSAPVRCWLTSAAIPGRFCGWACCIGRSSAR